jgi:hypothetical protein
MEQNYASAVRKLSDLRTKLLEKIRDRLPHPVFEANAFFHPFLAFTFVMIMVAIFSQERALDLFSFHPVLMSFGVLIFMAEALIIHKNNLLAELLGPIMQHSRKQKVRAIHMNLNFFGAFFLGMGFLFMVGNKMMLGKTLFPQTIHALFGWIALLLTSFQAVIGSQKMQHVDNKAVFNKTFRWHGDSGLLLWDVLCLSIVLGMLEYFGLSLFHLLVEVLVLGCWWMVSMILFYHCSSFLPFSISCLWRLCLSLSLSLFPIHLLLPACIL